jgi:multidrug resistance protein
MNSHRSSKQSDTRISTWIAFALLPLSGFATDIYVPSMPGMANQLGVQEVQIQSTLTFFLVSYGLSQLFMGSILDSFGRYRIGLFSMVIFSAASFVIALSVSINVILLMRVIQGISAATIIVAKRAYFVDVYSGDKLKHLMSLFTIIWSVGPIVAPFLGGYLDQFFGWQSNFLLLGGLVLTCAFLDWIFGSETIKVPVQFNLRNLAGIYTSMLKTRSFISGILILSFTYSIVMLYNMSGPFIIENKFHMNSVVSGYCSLALGFAWLFGGLISKRTILRPFYAKININISIQLLLVLLMLTFASAASSLAAMVFFAFLIQMNTAFTYNNYFTYCLSRFPDYAAMSGGLTGGIVYIMVSFFTYSMVHFIPPVDMTNLSISYLILTVFSAIVIFFVYRTQGSESRTA